MEKEGRGTEESFAQELALRSVRNLVQENIVAVSYTYSYISVDYTTWSAGTRL